MQSFQNHLQEYMYYKQNNKELKSYLSERKLIRIVRDTLIECTRLGTSIYLGLFSTFYMDFSLMQINQNTRC